MNTLAFSPSRAATLLAVLCSVLPCAAQRVAAVDAEATSAIQSLPLPTPAERLHVMTDPSGVLWARGNDWKASFDAASGFTFVPFLGSDQPRNHPLQLQLREVRAGGAPVAVDLALPATRDGDARIHIPRGSVVETYELSPAHVEQTFVVSAPVGAGALSFHMTVTTDLVAGDDGDGGFRFANAAGGVRYGRAIVFDAAGRRADVQSRLANGELVLTVPATFVADATFPLTVDPIVLSFALGSGPGTTLSVISPDGGYLGTNGGVYVIVVEEVYSAVDHDVYLHRRLPDGQIGPGVYIDLTNETWVTPQVASHRGASQFLVVAARGSGVGARIWATSLAYSMSGGSPVLTTIAQFPVQNFSACKNPDVGGDPNPSPPLPGAYCVTWEGQFNGELYYNLVYTNGNTMTGDGVLLDQGPEIVSNQAIAKSCGVGAWSTRHWTVVWQKRYSSVDEDIWGTVIGVNGAVQTQQFLIDNSGASETNPEVSSLTDPINGLERCLVVYQRLIPPSGASPPHEDIVAQLFAGTVPSAAANLSTLLNTAGLRDQTHPCVDTDGIRFAVGFTEDPSSFTPDVRPWLATLHVTSNDSLAVTSYGELTNVFTGPDEFTRITSERSGGTFSSRYLAVHQTTNLVNGATSAHGAFYFGHTNLSPGSWFNHALAGCGAMMLSASGLPALAHVFTLDLVGAQGFPFLLFGTSVAPIPLCTGCDLGVDPATAVIVPTSSLSIFVPANSGLIGVQFGAQGVDFLAPGGCSSPVPLALTNEIVITIL